MVVLSVCLSTAAMLARTDVAVGADVVGIVFTPHEAYRDVATLVKENLAARGYTCRLIELPDVEEPPDESEGAESAATTSATAPAERATTGALAVPPEIAEVLRGLAAGKPKVIVALGTRATKLTLQVIRQTPVVFCMIPNAQDAILMSLDAGDRARVAGVTTDAHPRKQLEWIKRLSPGVRLLGVPCSPRSRRTIELLSEQARDLGVSVVPIDTRKDEFPQTIEELSHRQCDAVLMVADAAVYNSAGVRALLLWGIRQKKPVWTFSDNVVKAGALGGLSVDSADVGRETTAVVYRILTGAKPSKLGLQYVEQPRVAINERTAEMIDVPLGSDILSQATTRFGKEQ